MRIAVIALLVTPFGVVVHGVTLAAADGLGTMAATPSSHHVIASAVIVWIGLILLGVEV